MSKREILEELPKLSPVDLREIRERLWQLEEESLLSGGSRPSENEKALLDDELEDYARDRTAGSSWEEAEVRLNLDAAFEPTPAMSKAIHEGLSSLSEKKTYSAAELRSRIAAWTAR